MSYELRTYALDQMHHRLQVRSYSLLDEAGSKITVHAALVESDEVTESNPFNQKTLSLSADALLPKSELFPWVDAIDGKQMLLTLAQVRSLSESLTGFQTDMYDFLDKICGEIDAGVITKFEQIDYAAWPS